MSGERSSVVTTSGWAFRARSTRVVPERGKPTKKIGGAPALAGACAAIAWMRFSVKPSRAAATRARKRPPSAARAAGLRARRALPSAIARKAAALSPSLSKTSPSSHKASPRYSWGGSLDSMSSRRSRAASRRPRRWSSVACKYSNDASPGASAKASAAAASAPARSFSRSSALARLAGNRGSSGWRPWPSRNSSAASRRRDCFNKTRPSSLSASAWSGRRSSRCRKSASASARRRRA